jgi:hypothetical protein
MASTQLSCPSVDGCEKKRLDMGAQATLGNNGRNAMPDCSLVKSFSMHRIRYQMSKRAMGRMFQ